MANVNIPDSPFLDPRSGKPAPEWLIWLSSPSFASINTGTPLSPGSGGTGTSAIPGSNQILVGNGATYNPQTLLPASAFPGLAGDVTAPAGNTNTTLASVTSPGSFGNGSNITTFTINAKGLVVTAGTTPITGAPGSFTAVTSFGCNGKAAQTSASVNAAVAGTAGATYTATEQGILNNAVSLLNQIRAALVANGICA